MARTLTLLHAADLHLGAPMRGVAHLTEEWRHRVLDAMTAAADRLGDVALRNEVDFVVIAGDLFDQARPSIHDVLALRRVFDRLEAAAIPIYVCGGNHDPYVLWQQENLLNVLPKNVHIFEADRPSFFLYERDGEPLCVLAGRSYYSKIWPADASISAGLTREAAEEALGERAARAPFGVGVLHTGLDLDTVKAPASRVALSHAGFDYWALGHIHRRQIDETATALAFSGCIQGRDLRETGRRGVNLVKLTEGGAPAVRFVPTAQIALARVRVDVTLCTAIPQVKERIMAALFTENGNALCERMISRVTLEGTTELHRQLSDARVREELRGRVNDAYDDFYCDEIIDRTIDPEVAEQLAAAAPSEEAPAEGGGFADVTGSAGPWEAATSPSDFFIDLADDGAETVFSGTLMRAAEEQRESRGEEIAYLQEEFQRFGVEFASADTTVVDRLAAEAERLNLDSLNATEESAS